MARYRNNLPQFSGRFFLTDGGIETTLIFHEGLDLPDFAAFDLLKDDAGSEALRNYFRTYAALARKYETGFILESPTWRASADWGGKLGYSDQELAAINRKAIALLCDIRAEYETKTSPMVISGCVGPRGDGYTPTAIMSAAEAQQYHQTQIEVFSQTDADLVTAITMNYVDEAIGIVWAATAVGMPVVISFTVETDGRLPTGQSLKEAIERVDAATQGAPAYYMINCAHPLHFEAILAPDEPWTARICGVRANASTRSHAELNESPELDAGDPVEFGRQHRGLFGKLTKLTVLGGCCGTDHRHVEEICKACLAPFDISWVRSQFPALAQTVNSQGAIFFDGPGGTQVPQRVIDAMAEYLIHSNANTHGAFATSERTDATIDAAHAAMADLLGCDPDEVVFGPNMTTLTFMISRAIGKEIQPGDEIVVTRLDHDANVAPWVALEERGAVIRYVDIDVEDCTLDMDDLRRQITPRTRLIAVGYASNAVGTINDVAEVARLAREAGALSFIDAVHYAPHGPIDVRALDCDFLACSPYKFFAPHAGVLYGKREHLLRLKPSKVRPASDDLPGRWMTGTQNHEAMAGVAAAIDYLAELGARSQGSGVGDQGSGVGDQEAQIPLPSSFILHPSSSRRTAILRAMRAIQRYERALVEQLIQGLLAIPGLTFYGISDPRRFDRRTPTVSVRIEGHTPRALAEALGQRGIFVWDGNYYAIGLTERLGVEESGGMLRIGLVHYNTTEEVTQLLNTITQVVREGEGPGEGFPPP